MWINPQPSYTSSYSQTHTHIHEPWLHQQQQNSQESLRHSPEGALQDTWPTDYFKCIYSSLTYEPYATYIKTNEGQLPHLKEGRYCLVNMWVTLD